jgi:FAD/FMN-containing dehydrogenase
MHARLSTDPDTRQAFARDWSGLELLADAVARPRDATEVQELLREASATRTPVTPAGLQSSTTGASITDRGWLLSLATLSRIHDIDVVHRTMRVGAGARLADVRRAAAEAGLLFAPDPTSEEDSTVGGAIACNASGARSFRYGPTRTHVRALTVVLADGTRHTFHRPALEKNTVGYPLGHDPVDWFVGSEGTLGVVVEAELALLPLPEQVIGLAIPFRSSAQALAFVVAARESAYGQLNPSRAPIESAPRSAHDIAPRCFEFFDARAVDLVRSANPGTAWTDEVRALVYTEDARLQAHDVAAPLDAWLRLAEAHGALTDELRVYDGESALADARRLRHAVPSIMNARGARCRAQGGRKVSTDWAVPYHRLADALDMAHALADAAGVPRSVTYGHAGNGHPHQNFLAHNADELARLQPVLAATLTRVVAMGGTVAAEHGIGKLKREWLPLQITPLQQRVMHALKHTLDPYGLMAPGNVL